MGNAWVFPGQGSQKQGMAAGLTDHPLGKERFALASQLMGRDLLAICRGETLEGEGPADLNDTRNTQAIAIEKRAVVGGAYEGPCQRNSAAPQLKPAPKPLLAMQWPGCTRPSRTASSSINGMVAAEVLP